MSTTLVKVLNKGQVTIPTRLRVQAGIAEGDLVEAVFERGRIVLTPKTVIDRSLFPTADDEYTPKQRQIVDGEVARGLDDVRRGRTFGPFKTVEEMIASVNAECKKRAGAKKSKRSK